MHIPLDGPPVVRCTDCLRDLPESASTAVEDRTPCPACGSTKRLVAIASSATVSVYELLGLTARHGTQGGRFLRKKVGDELYHDTGKWQRVARTVNRADNVYEEIITDTATGQVIRFFRGPLDQHQGHGDAKRSQPDR
jgi:hypothetical protein